MINHQKMIDSVKAIDEQIAYHEAVIKHLQERRREEINRQNLNKEPVNG